jgi:hypothetical protein
VVCKALCACGVARYTQKARGYRDLRVVDTRTAYAHHERMNLLDRDRQIIALVGRFSQLTSGQIRNLVFHDSASDTPSYRALNRLLERNFLRIVQKPFRGGRGAGSGPNVYQLGSEGWKLLRRDGRYQPMRSVHDHTIAIADAYSDLVDLERTGEIRIDVLLTEPDSWLTIRGIKLLPDLYLEVAVPAKRHTRVMWIEVDLGTERPRQLREKLDRYVEAERFWPVEKPFPSVYILVPDLDRLKEARYVINGLEPESRDLFTVGLGSEFPGLLFA